MAAFAGAVALALPGVAWAHGGPSYQAGAIATPPTIDGTVTSAEWSGATAYPIEFGPIAATVRFARTATDLYVAVEVADLAPGAAPSLAVYFDNNHDGLKDAGDDDWIDAAGSSGEDFFWDPAGAGGPSHYSDLTGHGTNDTIAAGTSGSGAVAFEFRHALCSGDSLDICASVGSTLGVDFQYQQDTAPGVFFDAPGPSTSDPSVTWGDLLLASSGGDTTPPSVTLREPAAGSVLSGTVPVAADATDDVGVTSVHFQYFDGTAYHDLGTDTDSPYTASFDTTTVADTAVGGGAVSAIASDAAGHTTSSANMITVRNGGGGSVTGSLAGTVVLDPGASPAQDLTALGSEDWAVWGYASGGTSTSLAPDVRKASGSDISNLQNVNPTSAVLRGIGQFAEPLSFNWSDGSAAAPAASHAQVGLQHDGGATGVSTLGDGFAFTVPADQTSRTLTVFVTTHRAAGRLIASLSDDSAAGFVNTLPLAGEDRTGVYTITYNAASAGQTLHVNWVESLDNCPSFHCDNAAIYAVALSGPAPAPPPPTSTGAPSIEGDARVGFVVNTDTGGWDGAPSEFAYQWQVSADSGDTWSNIAGADTQVYRVHVAQAGRLLRSRVVATNAGGAGTAYSSALTVPALPPNGAMAWSQFDTTTDQYEVWGANPGNPPSLIFRAAGYENKQPSFSPDGSQIALTSAQTILPGGSHLDAVATMPVDGSATPLVLASDSVGDEWPAWSPVGNVIAYVETDSGGQDGTGSLWLGAAPADPYYERHVLLPSNIEEHYTQPAWAPDGTQLAVVNETSPDSGLASPTTIDLVDSATGLKTSVVGPAAGLRHPHFNADGTVLYYDVDTPSGATLHAFSLETSADTIIPSGGFDRQAVPSPDGTLIAWLHNSDVVIGDATTGVGASLHAVSNSGGLAADPAWGTGTVTPTVLDTKLVSGPTFPAPAGSGVVNIEFAALGSPTAVARCAVDDGDAGACQSSYTFTPGTHHTILAEAVDGGLYDHTPLDISFFVPANSTNGSIAFQSQRTTGSFHIFKVKPSGGTPIQLTTATSGSIEQHPVWSPDGTTILFASNPDTPFDLYSINADGSGGKALSLRGPIGGTRPVTAETPAYSPDGQTIAFAGELPNNTSVEGIWTVPADLSAAPTLIAAPSATVGNAPFDLDPQWSPDGQRIVFFDGGTGFGHSIWVVDADGTDLAHVRASGGRDPTWAPTNDKIVFANDGEAQQRIWTMDPDGSNAAPVAGSPTDVFYPKYSPDGTKLVYMKSAPGALVLFTANADLSNEQQLTPVPVPAGPTADDFPDWGAAAASSIDTATANLTSDSTVEMSGSNDAIAGIPLSAFDSPSTSTQKVNGAPINTLPINTLPINTLPINTLPINTLPMNTLPMNTLPINTLPINTLPINTLPINTLGGWAAVLAGTTLAGIPLQTIMLQQVLDLHLPALAHLHLGDLDVSQSALGRLSIGALALGATPINTLGFTSSQLAALTEWCSQLAVATADVGGVPPPTPVANCTNADPLGGRSLFELSIEGAPMNTLPINTLPINTLPMNTLPINTLPMNTLDLSASPINTLPINTLPMNTLGGTTPTPINTLPLSNILAAHTPAGDPSPFRAIHISALGNRAAVVNCSATGVNCATDTLGDAAAHNAILGSARLLDILGAVGSLTIGDLHYYDALTIGDIVASIPGSTPFGDVLALLIRSTDVPWESLAPRALSAFDAHRPQLPLSAHFSFTGTGTTNAVVTVRLPAGFDYVPDSATLRDSTVTDTPTPQDPTSFDGRTVEWDLSDIAVGDDYVLDFKAYSGTDVGATQAQLKVLSGTTSDSSIASFSVGDSFEPNNAPLGLTATQTLTPNDRVQQSAITSAGDVDYYRIPMPPAGTRINVHLDNLSVDYDLALYANQTTSVRVAANTGAPLQDGTVADQSINLQGGTNPQLTPTALQDVPDPGVPLVQASANRGIDGEDVGMVSPGGGGYALIAVFGYNGAAGSQPYSLRVTTTTPATITCDARSFPLPGIIGSGTPGTASAVPADVNTIFLVNEKRLGDTYGSQGESDVASALTRLAGERALGISGAVLPVESISGVQDLYGQWDANPCATDRANAIANAVADRVASLKSTHPTLKYVVFVGGDDQMPYFRIPDVARIANEAGFAGDFANNEYYGALAGGNLLSDNPYLDTRPIPAGGRQLFIPDLVGGRLVEKPDQIVNAVTNYEHSSGRLDNSSAFVSGYDFVTDGAQHVESNLNAFLGANGTRTLISNTWSKNDLLGHAFPVGGPASINSWNGHYDNYEALAANGDHSNLLTTADLTGPHALSGGVFFTMGCHAGFQTTDAIVGATAPDALDWAEYFARAGTGFVANTGFGLGNTDSVAFSEELMAGFAQNLDGSMSIGDALTRAKADYYLGRLAFSSYDEKTLSEAELYGLPMYGVGTSPAALSMSASAPSTVRGTTSSTSPSDGALSALTGVPGVQVAGFAVTPRFEATPVQGDHGQYFTNDGLVQAPNYRPLQPFVTLPATRAQAAHGVLVDALTSNDVPHFDPDNVRPTLDLSANEPEPQFADEAWPEKVPTLVSLRDANGLRQSLNLATGQFFTDAASHDGVERQWTHVTGRVTYSSSPDFVPPTIDSIDAFVSNGSVTFTGRFNDLTESGAPGTVALGQVVYDVDNSGTWRALPLQHDAVTGLWSAGASFSGAAVQFFVEACDLAGNCGFSSNKGRYFDARPLPQQTGALTLVPRRDPDQGSFYTSDVVVDGASTDAASIQISLDGGSFVDTASVTVSGDGAHTITARASDGTTASSVVLIDARPPDAIVDLPTTVRRGDPATVTYSCADGSSAVSSCSGAQNGGPAQISGTPLDTTHAGINHFVVTTADRVGNSQQVDKTFSVVPGPTAPGKPTADKPVNNGSFTLSWAAANENGFALTYAIERSASTTGPWTSVRVGISATSAALVGEPNGIWFYRVSASDGEFSGDPSPVSNSVLSDRVGPTVTVTCPTAPVQINSTASASWTATDSGSGVHGATSGTRPLITSVVGPQTAGQAVSDNVGNIGTGSCSYTVIWPFSGFFSPVDNLPTLNILKAGQAVPVKFGLGGNRGLAIFAAGYPSLTSISCASSAPTGVITETVTAGNSSLSYDAGANQYSYVWKSPSTGWASGTCKQLVLKLVDGTTHLANFKAK